MAFGVAPAENLEYWRQFLVSLSQALSLVKINNLVIINDTEKGLCHPITQILPFAFHSYCIYHIEKNMKVAFKTDTAEIILKAAKTANINEFERIFSSLAEPTRLKNGKLLKSYAISKLYKRLFPSTKICPVTSNLVESINICIRNIRDKAAFGILISVFRKMIKDIKIKQVKYSNW